MLSARHYKPSPAALFVYPEDAGEFEWYSRELEGRSHNIFHVLQP